ncbi:MAG: D-alanine--D-alanine ligase family protein [Acidobacteriota bacterium]
MKDQLHVSIIYNEPVVSTDGGPRYVSETGVLETTGSYEAAHEAGLIDMSEVGVLEQKEDIESALKLLGYRTTIFNVTNDINRFMEFLRDERPDVVFNMVESLGDQAIHEMHVAGMYELLQIAYTGAGPMTLGTCLNKARTKQILAYHGIMTPKFFLTETGADCAEKSRALSYPMIVKPALEDASVGIDNASIVYTAEALAERVRYVIAKFEQPALVEEYIEGRELNVAILGDRTPEVLPISEIDFSALPEEMPKIVTYNAKWMHNTPEFHGTVGKCPAVLPQDVESRVKTMALEAFQIMGCRDYARVDIRLSAQNVPYVIEVNPNPDISHDAGFMRSAKTSGRTFSDVIQTIIECAVARHRLSKPL